METLTDGTLRYTVHASNVIGAAAAAKYGRARVWVVRDRKTGVVLPGVYLTKRAARAASEKTTEGVAR